MPGPKLTLGMATFEDFDGVYFSVQSLRLHHPEVMPHCEIVVVDNNPNGPQAQTLRDFLGWVKGDVAAVHYVPFTESVGTAAPRDLIFRMGTAPHVLCMDSHVILPPGALAKLLAYYDANPDTRDLLQGPMLYDDLKNFATHYTDKWEAEMWGQWGAAWYSP